MLPTEETGSACPSPASGIFAGLFLFGDRMNCGWVKMYRKFSEWEWYKTPNMAHLFMHLVISANHIDGRWQGIEVKKGQLVTGRLSLSEQTGISEQSIRTALNKLKSTGEITIKSTSKFSIITICNYIEYQTQEIEANQQINQQTNQQLTNNQPATNHKQECKEGKEEKHKSIVGHNKPAVPVSDIVQYLNEKSGKEFRAETKATRQHITARFKEGFSLSDFQSVIDFKVSEWGMDAKMMEFIRPQTLFGTNFESYLEAAKTAGYNGHSSGMFAVTPPTDYHPPIGSIACTTTRQ